MHAINRYLVGVVGVSVVLAMVALTPIVGPAEARDLKAWDKTFNNVNKRFKLRMGNMAVLDKETSLVWEQSPLTTTYIWRDARFQCTDRTVGGRKGWRLPSVHELNSLVDPGNPGGNPSLPPGHPFSNVQGDRYWTATSDADSASGTTKYFVQFSGGFAGAVNQTLPAFVWCVRGGMNADAY